jgi:hypothetical protein
MITLDLLGMGRDELLMAIRELDREAGARGKCYPKLVADGKLTPEVVETRRLALAAAREVCACVARGMIAADSVGLGVRVLPVLPAQPATEDGETEDGE